MRVLVTGASGFLGRHLVSRLRRQGDEVWTLVHDEDPHIDGIHTIRGSVSDLAVCERAMVESRAGAVFHLAAQAIVPYARQDPYGTLEANVRGTYCLLEAFRRHRSPFSIAVVASSDKAYGECPVETIESGHVGWARQVTVPRPYREDDPLAGRGPYDVSKSCTDLIAQSYGFEFSLPIGIVRAGNIYGPGDTDMTRVVPSIVSALVRNRAPVLTSDGTPVRDYLYVSDAVEAYLALIEDVPGRLYGSHVPMTFNFSGGEPVSVMALAEMTIRIAGTPEIRPDVLGTRVGEIQSQVLDSTLARETLGWKPRVGLEAGLRETYGWWMRRRHG